jgi:hypothetical protein
MEGATLNEAMQTALRATEAGRRWTQAAPAEALARKALLDALEQQGAVLEAAGKHPDAKRALEEALGLADAIAAEDSVDARKALALTLEQLGEEAAALTRVREGEAILDRLIAGAPENNGWRHSRIELTSLRSRLLNEMAHGDAALTAQAIEAQREAYTMARASAAGNPRDLVELDLAATMAGRLANRLMNSSSRLEESLAVQRESVSLIDQMLAVDSENRRFLYLRANAGLIAGYNLMNAARWREAREAVMEGERFSKRSLAKDPEDVRVLQTNNGLLMMLTRTERNLGNLDRARERCREAMASSENLIQKNKKAKEPVAMIEILHSEAKLLGVPDTTLRPE